MKHLATMLAALFVATAASAQPKATRVSGQLEGIGDTLLYNLIDMNLDSPRSKGQYASVDGKFDFTIDVEHPATFAIMDLKTIQTGDAGDMKVASVTIIPGEDVTLNGSLSDYTIGGAEIYTRMNEIQTKMMDFYKGVTCENVDSISKAFKAYALDYIKAHPSDEAAMLMVQAFDNEKELNDAVALFTPEVRDGRMAGLWKPLVKMFQAQAQREEAAKKIVEGVEAPDFTLPDLDGKPLTLSSLRGQYVVLDFWGSWCGWCIKGIPDMKKYYEKYAGKFEILGVDCNDTEEKWKAAVKKHEIPWKHVRQSNETVSVSDSYGISGYPTKIVIDPQGKIAKVVVGEEPEFYTYLDTLFGGK